jgi:hypothetical protein
MGEHRLDVHVDESLVEAAMSALSGLTDSERTSFMRGVIEAVLAYRMVGKTELLEQLAGDIEATVRLRQVPEYVDAVRTTPPPSSTASRRSVQEILAGVRP